MRRLSSSERALRSRWVRLTLAAAVVGMMLFALAPRAGAVPVTGAASMRMPGHAAMPMPQEDGPGASEMAPHAPVEIPVSDDLHRVLTSLLCQCGCNLDAYVCQQTMTCDISTAMWDQATKLVDEQGVTPARALELFAADYGERVLASPIKRGFNLMAWILPLVAIVLGAGILAFALRGWRERQPVAAPTDAPPIDPRYLVALERELSEED